MTARSWHTHDLLDDGNIRHGWTDAGGPDFKVDPGTPAHDRAIAEIVTAAGLEEAAWAHQVHGGTVLYVTGPGPAGEADALWTDVPGLGVVGRSADCPLVLVAGRREDGATLTGFAHASWRSTVRGVTGDLVGRMIAGGMEPATTRAVICPSAGPCCYEVGAEVHEAAIEALGSEAGWFFVERTGNHSFNLWAANRAQLEAYGIPTEAIGESGICTICGDGYPSHRRDGDGAGRFAAIIGPAGQSSAGA